MTHMLALVKEKAQPGLWLKQVPVPEVGPDEVRIKILKTAICGTDVQIVDWNDWARRTVPQGLTIGHEFVGVVDAVGVQVHDCEVGERVSGEGHLVCGVCRNCLAGRKHLCKDTKGIGVNQDGAFAQYLLLPRSNIWRCSPSIPDDVVACFDPLGNATHTALTYDIVGEDVLITGAGPIGLMATAICRHIGARHIVVTDLNDDRLALAARLGASKTINSRRQPISAAIQALGMKEGFDVGLEMSGSGQALAEMVDNLYHGGKVALLGIPDEQANVNWEKVVFNGLTIKGIYGREMFETWYKMSTMLESGLSIAPIITHRFPVDHYKEAFEVMRSGRSGKVILDWAATF